MTEQGMIWRFSPGRTDPELLEAIFVQRHGLLKDSLERVKESATTESKHHLLLVGPRGIGKTHFVSLLRYRVVQDAVLSKQVRVAWLNEDETTTSFLQLLVRIYRSLAGAYPEEFSLDLLDEIPDLRAEEMPRVLQENLLESLGERTILLLVENMDLLFGGLGADGQQSWRAFLQEHSVLCTVATSQQLFEEVSQREHPFYGFFETIHLKPLTVDEATDLLAGIAKHGEQHDLSTYLETPEGHSRVRALHHLAGGNHRVYIVLSEFITRETMDELVIPFQKMLDDLTPYYQERLRSLSPLQRQIVELLCVQKSPISNKQIARLLFKEENSISTQVRKLRELGYVVSHSRQRESLSELTEPLMRLAYEVKETGAEPLRLIVDFLRIWYRRDELETKLHSGGMLTQSYVSAAIKLCDTTDDPRMAVIQRAIDLAISENRLEEAI